LRWKVDSQGSHLEPEDVLLPLDEKTVDLKVCEEDEEEEYVGYEDIPSGHPQHRSHGAMNGGSFMSDIEMMFGGSI
jgi:hypothetical protein